MRIKPWTITGYIACLLLGLVAAPVYGVFSGILWGREIQSLKSPDERHKASLLKKYNLADMNFIVKVDGERVYVGSDLMMFPDHMYRETLLWDDTGKVVALELMGKRVFAYDTEARRELGKGELNQYKLHPVPSDQNYAQIKDIDE